jgi:hypothetical protein
MILCLGAAICAGAIVANPSSPVARPADQNQNKLSATAMGPAIRVSRRRTIPFGRVIGQVARKQLPASHMIQPPGALGSKSICVIGLVVSAMEGIIGRHTR